MIVLAIGGVGVAILFSLSFLKLPAFGQSSHPYRDLAVAASVEHATANVVSAINFDQRGLDTLGEETILLASVVGAATLLRPSKEELEHRSRPTGRPLEASLLMGYLLLPVTLVIGVDVVAHGHLTPGGGFQGGVVLGTGIHLLYITGTYQALERVRPLNILEYGEALGTAAFVGIGIAGTIVSSAFLANMIPPGQFAQLQSAGTVPLLSGAVGLEVASGIIVLLAKFLQQAITISPASPAPRPRGAGS
jgi:multicomponent Na+:H+ antiporter subunit B